VERLNQTVKKTLAHVCRLHPKQLHKMIPLVRWSIRESTNQSLRTSPFMMVMGRNPSNPLSLIKDTWTGTNPVPHPAGKTVSEYLMDLQAKLKEIHDLANQHTIQEQQRYVDHYNKRAVDKHFSVGQQVIVLIPDSTKKMVSRWQRPGTIIESKSPYSYLVELDQGQRCWLHANKLRPYHARVQEMLINNCSIVYEADEESGSLPIADTTPSVEHLPSTKIDSTKLNHLTAEQKRKFLAVLDEYPQVFSEKPGLCKVGVHETHVTPNFKPKRL